MSRDEPSLKLRESSCRATRSQTCSQTSVSSVLTRWRRPALPLSPSADSTTASATGSAAASLAGSGRSLPRAPAAPGSATPQVSCAALLGKSCQSASHLPEELEVVALRRVETLARSPRRTGGARLPCCMTSGSGHRCCRRQVRIRDQNGAQAPRGGAEMALRRAKGHQSALHLPWGLEVVALSIARKLRTAVLAPRLGKGCERLWPTPELCASPSGSRLRLRTGQMVAAAAGRAVGGTPHSNAGLRRVVGWPRVARCPLPER